MKLIYKVAIRLSIAMVAVLVVWAVFFYLAVIDEVNDEVDDSLEDYSEVIIMRALSGRELPSMDNGTNNMYFLQEVTPEYASTHDVIAYSDDVVFIEEKQEEEPARVLKNIFKDKDGRFFELTVAIPNIEKTDLVESILYWILLLFFVLLCVMLIINLLIYRRCMQPLYVLLNWLDNYKVGSENESLVNSTDITEFSKLNGAAIRNAGRQEMFFEQQKQFIGNASHEIQTPVAVCLNRLELLLDTPSLSEEVMGELIKIQHTLKYISRLNKSLLFLTKIDNNQFHETTKVDVKAVVERYINDYREVYAYKNITLQLDLHESLVFDMNETLCSSLVNNLLKNAFVYNVDGGRVEVSIDAGRLAVRNTGLGEPLNADKLFERFYQTHKSEGSTGLGLAIVDSICRLYGIERVYSFDGGMHIFSIDFSRFHNPIF